jgi:hypothetical protein
MDHNDPKKHSDHPAQVKPGQGANAPQQQPQPSQASSSSAKGDAAAPKAAQSGHDDKTPHGGASGGPGKTGTKHTPDMPAGGGGSPSRPHADSDGNEQGHGQQKKAGHGDQHSSGSAGSKPAEQGQRPRSDAPEHGAQSEHGGKKH